MPRKLLPIALFLLALAPSAYLAWKLRAMAHLGYYHDDSIYWVSAKSLAEGNGYRIQSLPGEPFQTKYPPLYPALLATVWKAVPEFPANLPLATFGAWLLFPPYLAMVWIFLRRCGFTRWEQLTLGVMAGLSPVAVVFSFSLMPELLFTALLLGSLMLAERGVSQFAPRWLAVVAGVCAGLAYLTKSAAGPLLLTVPLCFALRRQFVKAALFVAAMLPAMLGWQWWASQHVSRSWDLVTLYYTNYFGYQLFNVAWRDLPLVMWHNLDGFLMGAGTLLAFDVPIGSKHLERVVAVAAIAGVVRLAKQNRQLQYPLAGLGMSIVLLIWHFTPDQRFVFPLYPLLLAGLWTELKNVYNALRLSWNKPALADRGAALAGAGLLAGFAGFVVLTTLFGLFFFLPALFDAYRADQAARRPAYEWIARNTPAEANVYAYDDPLVFLYSGRKACSLPVPPKLTYHNDTAGIDKLLDSVAGFASEYHLGYALLKEDDFYRDLHERGARRVAAAVTSSGAFQQLFSTPSVKVYRFRANGAVDSPRASLRPNL